MGPVYINIMGKNRNRVTPVGGNPESNHVTIFGPGMFRQFFQKPVAL